jgi:hypothetical protein
MSQSQKQTTRICHTRETGYPDVFSFKFSFWIPASAGMTPNREQKSKSTQVDLLFGTPSPSRRGRVQFWNFGIGYWNLFGAWDSILENSFPLS